MAQPTSGELGPVSDQSFRRLLDWLAIPSVSPDPRHAADIERAAAWIGQQLDEVPTASVEVVRLPGGSHPSVIARVEGNSGSAQRPTVVVYGHFDVQPPGDPSTWTSPPFSPEIRDGWLYCRGAADSKVNSFIVIEAIKGLAAERALPVDVELLFDAEEEIDGTSVPDFVASRRRPDVAIICDGALWDERTPCFWVTLRGTLYYRLAIRTAERELHSGTFGGAALNAAQAMVACLLEATAEPLGRGDARGGEALPATPIDGAEILAQAGARPASPAAAAEFYERTVLRTAVDINSIAAGDAGLRKTVIPDLAVADVSVRIGPGDELERIDEEFRARLRSSAPAGAELKIEAMGAVPAGRTAPDSEPIRLAAQAFERAFGAAPLLVGNGGTLPLFSTYAEQGVPTILTGFASPDGAAHAADERFPLRQLPLGIAAMRGLLAKLAEVEPS